MLSSVMFVIGTLLAAILFTAVAFTRKKINPITYFKTKEGKGVLFGIVMFVGFGTLFSIPSCVKAEELEYLQWSSVYMGLDNTNHQSPMCEDGSISSRLTSNGGIRLNLIESSDDRFTTNLKYTHHSCAFNADDKSYDSIGIETEYKFWTK